MSGPTFSIFLTSEALILHIVARVSAKWSRGNVFLVFDKDGEEVNFLNVGTGMSSAEDTGNSEPILEKLFETGTRTGRFKGRARFLIWHGLKSDRLVPRCAILWTKIHAVDANPPVKSWLPIQFRIDSVYHR